MKYLLSSLLKWAICLAIWFFAFAVGFNISPDFEIEHLGVRIALTGFFWLIASLITYLRMARKW